jgi:hypothetical protein
MISALDASAVDRRPRGPVRNRPSNAPPHLSTLRLDGDETLLRRLSEQVLAPLDAAPGPQRDRLAETLLAWLDSGSSVAEVAAYPQTVR